MVKAARSPAAPKPPADAASTGAPSKTAPAKRKSAVAAKPSVAKATAPRSTARGAAKGRTEAVSSSARKPRASAKVTASPASKRATRPTAKPASTTAKPAAKATSKPTSVPCAPINLGFLSGFVGFHLRLAQDASYRAFARFKDKDLVKPGRFPALAIIHLNPGISQSALGRAIARDKSTVSPLIKDLQKNGLISRKPSPNDRRSVTLVLTKKGERVLDRLHARALEHEEDLDKVIGTSKSRLVGMLDKITASLAA